MACNYYVPIYLKKFHHTSQSKSNTRAKQIRAILFTYREVFVEANARFIIQSKIHLTRRLIDIDITQNIGTDAEKRLFLYDLESIGRPQTSRSSSMVMGLVPTEKIMQFTLR